MLSVTPSSAKQLPLENQHFFIEYQHPYLFNKDHQHQSHRWSRPASASASASTSAPASASGDRGQSLAVSGGWVALRVAIFNQTYVKVDHNGILRTGHLPRDVCGRLPPNYLFQIQNQIPSLASTTLRSMVSRNSVCLKRVNGRPRLVVQLEKKISNTKKMSMSPKFMHTKSRPPSMFRITLSPDTFVAFKSPITNRVLSFESASRAAPEAGAQGNKTASRGNKTADSAAKPAEATGPQHATKDEHKSKTKNTDQSKTHGDSTDVSTAVSSSVDSSSSRAANAAPPSRMTMMMDNVFMTDRSSGLVQTFKVIGWQGDPLANQLTFAPAPTMSFTRQWMPEQGVISASYGSQSRRIDVTDAIQGMVSSDGYLTIPAHTDLTVTIGTDPAKNRQKELTVTYRKGMVTHTWTHKDRSKRHQKRFVGRPVHASKVLMVQDQKKQQLYCRFYLEPVIIQDIAGFVLRVEGSGECVCSAGPNVFLQSHANHGPECLFHLIAAYPISQRVVSQEDIQKATNILPVPTKKPPPPPTPTSIAAARSATSRSTPTHGSASSLSHPETVSKPEGDEKRMGGEVESLFDRLRRFYHIHNKDKLSKVGILTDRYEGKEIELNAQLMAAYKSDLNSLPPRSPDGSPPAPPPRTAAAGTSVTSRNQDPPPPPGLPPHFRRREKELRPREGRRWLGR